MQRAQLALVVLLAAGFALWFAAHSEPTTDWTYCYEPAAEHLLAGESPYRVGCFFNPPWMPLIAVPFTALGDASFEVWLFASLIGLALVTLRIGGPWWIVPLVWLSPPAISMLRQGQADWLVYLSVVVPPWLGAFLVMLKPQVGIGLAALLTVRIWRRGGVVDAVRLWFPPLVALAGSLLLWGNWPARASFLPDDPLNISIWPVGVPVGVVVLFFALRRNSTPLALIAGPLLSPYYNYFSLTGVVLAFVRRKWLLILLIGVPWLIVSFVLVTRLVLS